ncbi:MAG: restriction endonuclease subunit S [Phascolarctobacterium sp.]|nr:restriction endonuclease subunit S [Phascolarctobacterium sp.]
MLIKFPAVLDCQKKEIPYINRDCVSKLGTVVLHDKDVIIADTAEDETVGKATELINVGEQRIVSGLHTIPCRPKQPEQFAPKWLGYFINHRSYHNQLLPLITGTKVSSVSKSAIADTVIVIPERNEQEHIVDALSDIDELILDLEKLISKKKDMRKGVMQELLTGKCRLHGFSKDWKCTLLKNSDCEILNGDRGSNYPSGDDFKLHGVPFVNAGHLKNGQVDFDKMDYISYEHYERMGGAKLKAGDILFCLRGSLGKFATVDFDEGAPASSLCVLRCNGILKPAYLYYLLGAEQIRKQIESANTGSSQPNLSADNMSEFELFFPEDEKEQMAIVNLLADMDQEIALEQYKLDKYRMIKTGMADSLLTGNTRLQ